MQHNKDKNNITYCVLGANLLCLVFLVIAHIKTLNAIRYTQKTCESFATKRHMHAAHNKETQIILLHLTLIRGDIAVSI